MDIIQFDIKYRKLIERGLYKVVTEFGNPVRIVCWDKKSKYPVIGVVEEYGTERSYSYLENGRTSELFTTKADLYLIRNENFKVFGDVTKILRMILAVSVCILVFLALMYYINENYYKTRICVLIALIFDTILICLEDVVKLMCLLFKKKTKTVERIRNIVQDCCCKQIDIHESIQEQSHRVGVKEETGVLKDMIDEAEQNGWSEIDVELEGEINRYVMHQEDVDENVSVTRLRNCARHFAKWQKEKLMNKAVDGVVVCNELTGGHKDILFDEISDNFKVGDKLSIIILPRTVSVKNGLASSSEVNENIVEIAHK